MRSKLELEISDQHRPHRLAGGTLPQWMQRGAEDRLDKRWWRNVALITSITALCAVLACIYFAHLPREIPVPILLTADGHWSDAVITEREKVAADKTLLANWLTGCRSGNPDPFAMANRTCSALLDQNYSKGVAGAVHEYNDEIASSGMRPEAIVLDVSPSNSTYTLWRITWDERRTINNTTTLHAMWADLTVARSDARAVLHGQLINTYGLYVTAVRIVDEGEKKA